MADFGRDEELDLEYGVRIRAVQVSGTAGEISRAPTAGSPVRDAAPGTLPEALDAAGQPAAAAEILGAAAERAGMRRELTLPLADLALPPRGVGRDRDGADTPHIELTVPAPAGDEGQVVLEIDDTGMARWHLPVTPTGGATGGAEGGVVGDRASPVQTFRIPVEELDIPGAPVTDRGVLGFGLRKVLHVIRFPVETLAAQAGEFAVAWWERRHRPYGLGLVTPATVRLPLDPSPVPAARLDELSDKPFLLLVPGTFSRGRTAFDGLAADPTGFAELYRRYDERVLMFNHPTLHVDPDANVAWFLDQLPDRVPLTFDVLCHSRGGLVGRQLSAKVLADRARRPAPVIRRLVHVATPNAGTVLASPGKWNTLLDVFTNLLALFPDSPGGVALEGVLEVVKQVATGVLGGLEGLAAMDPAGDYLRALNQGAGRHDGSVYAVASDFEPTGSASLAVRALNFMADPMFGSGNDLVVPTDGVYRAGGYTVDQHVVVPMASGISHGTYFADAGVRRILAEWLPGPEPFPSAQA